jgi:hypothetical protein
MAAIIIPIVFGVCILAAIIAIGLGTRERKPAPLSRDDALYRGFVGLARKIAYYNEVSPEWAVMIPAELTKEARELLDQEKKELRIRNGTNDKNSG